jgi:hypothetical protein
MDCWVVGVPTLKVLPKYANFFIHSISDFYHALCSKMYIQLFMPHMKRQYASESSKGTIISPLFNQMIPCCGRGIGFYFVKLFGVRLLVS